MDAMSNLLGQIDTNSIKDTRCRELSWSAAATVPGLCQKQEIALKGATSSLIYMGIFTR
jgi:hypothetical protein